MPDVLSDLGERRILAELLPRYVAGIGDDCATIKVQDAWIVVSTDPVPSPAAKEIGGSDDLYWRGWLLTTINASDLAAAGASPLGFLAAIEAPADCTIASFERLLCGIRDACREEGLPYIGGNIREASSIAAVGTVVGLCRSPPISRKGATPGDAIVSIGHGGVFWRDALAVKAGRQLADSDKSPLYKPVSQLKGMGVLAGRGLIAAAMDNSDGLLPSLVELATKNALGIELNVDALSDPGDADGLIDDPARLWLGWGDWNVVAAIPRKHIVAAKEVALAEGILLTEVGTCVGDSTGVRLRRGAHCIPAPRLESERFARDSWFATGIDAYIHLLKTVELP